MARKLVIAGLALGLSALAGATGHAAPPTPTQPDSDPGAVFEGEASTGTWDEAYDDHGSEVSVVDRKYLFLRYYNGDDYAHVYFNIRGGSAFYLNYCDEEGFGQNIVQVSRKQFLERVASTQERRIHFTYDADRDSGVFVVTSGYYIESNDNDFPTCDPAGSNAIAPPGKRGGKATP